MRISYFQQFKNLFPDEIKNIVATFPNLYATRQEGNGTYVILKEVYPDADENPKVPNVPEAEEMKIENSYDDECPF